MQDLLEQKLARFEQLERQMLEPEVLADGGRLAAVAREHGALAKLVHKYRRFRELNGQIVEAMEMAKSQDPEMRQLAEVELDSLRGQREDCWNELLDMTIGGEDAARTRCVMEIRAGTGGDEAALFARELYEMYRKFAERKRWKMEILDSSPTELGGFKQIVLGLEGEGVYRELQFESGGHRVQRVPETESKGRLQTSAATVAVMPEPEDVEIELKPDDYRVDRFAASGPGGQHVNRTASAVRLTHLETGVVVSCQDEKSQHKNLARALRVLKSRLYEVRRAEEEKRRASERKGMIGSGDRSQKIRTYNFPQNRVSDHRINLTLYKLDRILDGALQLVIDPSRSCPSARWHGASPLRLGGFKQIVLGLEGEGVYRELQFESGGHRVQRVPETESKGRLQTSAATVAVMPEPEDVEIELKPDDYRVDRFAASGPGGQHVNRTASAVRLTHLETGVVVSCQDEKSQHKNLARALRVLKSRLYEVRRAEEEKRRASERKGMIGSGDRSQKIRTYNFPQNRVSDHRINLTLYKLDRILDGALQLVIDPLLEHERQQLGAPTAAVE